MKLNFGLLQKNVDDLSMQLREIKSQIEHKKRAREEIEIRPCTKDEAIEVLHARIDVQAETYRNGTLIDYLTPHMDNFDALNSQSITPIIGGRGGHQELVNSIFGLFPDLVKDSIKKAVNAANWPGNAIKLKEKTKLLSALDKEIGELESDLEKMEEFAAKSGIFLKL